MVSVLKVDGDSTNCVGHAVIEFVRMTPLWIVPANRVGSATMLSVRATLTRDDSPDTHCVILVDRYVLMRPYNPAGQSTTC